MIHHVVLCHLLDGLSAADPGVVAAVRAEEGLSDAAPGWSFGPEISRRDGAPDFAGAGTFASGEALADFLASPAHQSVMVAWAGLARWVVADIEVTS